MHRGEHMYLGMHSMLQSPRYVPLQRDGKIRPVCMVPLHAFHTKISGHPAPLLLSFFFSLLSLPLSLLSPPSLAGPAVRTGRTRSGKVKFLFVSVCVSVLRFLRSCHVPVYVFSVC